MKRKDKVKTTPMNNAPAPLKIKEGRVTITLEDKDGNKEVVADHNMQTDAIEAYLANCGWLNSDNLNKSSLVPDLFGGIMLFDGEIDEERLTLSEGLYMIANGGLGVTNTGTPYELGSCSEIETETGWQSDGSYLQTYRWDENHGNCPSGKSIQSVCLVPKWYGICGEGNGSGEISSSRGTPRSWGGSATSYSVTGNVAKVSIVNSEAWAVDISDIANSNITIRKYRIPTRKINLKGTPSAPILLEENTITAPANLVTELTRYGQKPGYDTGTIAFRDGFMTIFSVNGSRSGGSKWGVDYTQRLWEIDVVNATVTETTILNTTGETMLGMFNCIWVDDNTIAFVNGYCNYLYDSWTDGTKVWVVKRSQGSFGAMTKYDNPIGVEQGTRGYAQCGWRTLLTNHDGRLMVGGGNGASKNSVVLDTVGEAIYVTNSSNSAEPSNDDKYDYISTDLPLINFRAQGGTLVLVRDSAFMSTIFNCQTAYTKDATKTMTVVYRLTFEEEEEENE